MYYNLSCNQSCLPPKRKLGGVVKYRTTEAGGAPKRTFLVWQVKATPRPEHKELEFASTETFPTLHQVLNLLPRYRS